MSWDMISSYAKPPLQDLLCEQEKLSWELQHPHKTKSKIRSLFKCLQP